MTGPGPYVNRRILVVDDNPEIHEDLRKLLAARSEQQGLAAARAAFFGAKAGAAPETGYQLDSAYQGQEALAKVQTAAAAKEPYAMAFVDSRMPPGWNGIETVQRLWDVDPHLLVVICTAYSDFTWEEMAELLKRADAFLVLKKPFDAMEVRQLAAALTTQWDLARRVERESRIVMETRDLTVFALAQLADSRDPETGDHLCRMRAYAQILAEQLHARGVFPDELNERFLEDLYRASPLHDIGKVGIPDSVLLKPGRLTPEEFSVMRTHAEIGARTLERAARRATCGDFLEMAIDVAWAHHERFDGRGYPRGLAGDQIPLSARIVALADVYDALTSARVYKAAMLPAEARQIIVADSGVHFDPRIIEAFTDSFDRFLEVPGQVERADAEFLLPTAHLMDGDLNSGTSGLAPAVSG